MDKVILREVGLRDGLQSVKTLLATHKKLEWIALEAAAGICEIEVTSMVRPDLVPQLADSADVLVGALAVEGLCVAVLVPNLRGAERAAALGAHKMNYVLSASETHNHKNVGRSLDDSLLDFGRIKALTTKTRLCAGISTAFGCTMEGWIDPVHVARIAEHLAKTGAAEIILADTVGYADPRSVAVLVADVTRAVGDIPIAAHFHDSRGLGLANVAAALDSGVRRFDASLGGLGGCPFAPGATGNVVMEDVIFLCESMGFATGVDLAALLDVRSVVAGHMPDERLHGAYSKAGPRRGFAI